jgi:transcriptional regulator GlxA family with amidase domain
MKNRLKYERIEKEHILEQLRLRMEIQPDLKKAAEATEPQPITEAAAEQMSSTDKKFLVEINTTVEANLSDSDFNVQSLCEQVGLGNKLVYRKLKQLTGMTPVEYIRTIRLSKASILLQQKKFTISEVMYLSGFSNASYFSKCFQAKYGCTPREYAERS